MRWIFTMWTLPVSMSAGAKFVCFAEVMHESNNKASVAGQSMMTWSQTEEHGGGEKCSGEQQQLEGVKSQTRPVVCWLPSLRLVVAMQLNHRGVTTISTAVFVTRILLCLINFPRLHNWPAVCCYCFPAEPCGALWDWGNQPLFVKPHQTSLNGEFNSAACAGLCHSDFVTDSELMANKKMRQQWLPGSVHHELNLPKTMSGYFLRLEIKTFIFTLTGTRFRGDLGSFHFK